MNRRKFIQSLTFAAGAPTFLRYDTFNFSIFDDDATLCSKKFEIAVSMNLQKKPIGEVVVEIGKTFLGTEYVANTLEQPGEERLVVNMRGLDCVSFYENALVLARCIKKNKMTFDDYKAELQFIRYRGGKIDGYPSRLHYTSDYIYDNEKKNVWKNVTKELGGVPFTKKVGFMSTHPDSYRQIKENPAFVSIIAEQEKQINAREKFYIPKENVEKIVDKLLPGDIVGMTTDFEGLDTSHTGIIIREDGVTKLMHAPLAGKKVLISDSALPEYLAGNKRQTGIMVARPLEPV